MHDADGISSRSRVKNVALLTRQPLSCRDITKNTFLTLTQTVMVIFYTVLAAAEIKTLMRN